MAGQVSLLRRMLRPLLRPILRRVLPRVLPPTALGPADMFREIHLGLFDREPTPEAAVAFTNALANRTLSIHGVIAELRGPAAPAAVAAAEMTAEDLVRELYLGLLGREPDKQETRIYANAIASGLPLEQAISELGAADESRRRFGGSLLVREQLVQVAALVEVVLQQRLRGEGVELRLPSAAAEVDPLRLLGGMHSALLALTAEPQADAQLATSRA